MEIEHKEGRSLKAGFLGKEYVFDRLNTGMVRIRSGAGVSYAAVKGEFSVDMARDFYDRPYMVRFDLVRLPPGSSTSMFLRLPLSTRLMLHAGNKAIEIDRHVEFTRNAWYGAVHLGVLCTFVQAEFQYDVFKTEDALVPLRVTNRGDETRELSRIVIDPMNLRLYECDNGMFTDEVYVDVLSSNEFGVEYGIRTSPAAIEPRVLIDRKMSIAQTVLIKFDKLGIAKELGL
ncbi:MAG TPA: DUF432 domain-containing protein [Candidatus Methanoperedenaceae archaeon]|nr:DUF432 domain-containing protein [Candidatus Methanoperedenaceae archaeon]